MGDLFVPVVPGLSDSDVEALRPQATAALTISGSGDSLTASPDWSAATILTASPAGNIAIDVVGCPDGASRWLRLTPANVKTVTLSTSTGTLVRLGGVDSNPIIGDGTTTTVVSIARMDTVYAVTITLESAFS